MCVLCETDKLNPCYCHCEALALHEDEYGIILCANCGEHTVQITGNKEGE